MRKVVPKMYFLSSVPISLKAPTDGIVISVRNVLHNVQVHIHCKMAHVCQYINNCFVHTHDIFAMYNVYCTYT